MDVDKPSTPSIKKLNIMREQEPCYLPMDPEPAMPVKAPIDVLKTCVIFVFPALGGLLFGYDIGATSAAVPILEDAAVNGVSWGQLNTLQNGMVTSASLLGAVIGSAIAIFLRDKIGRKFELLLSAGCYAVGAILSAAAPLFPVLILGKMLYGLGIGFALHAAPAYLAEVGHPRIRGLLISMKEVFIGIGIELGYLIGLPCVTVLGGWRIVFGMALLFALIMKTGMVWLPESPRWLLLAGRHEDAREALVWTRGKPAKEDEMALTEEFDDIKKSSAETMPHQGWFHLFNGQYTRPMLIGLSLMFFQQVTGQPSVLYYATSMFQRAGLAMGQEATGIAGILGAFKLACTCVAVLTVDKFGRRPLLLIGVGGMFFSSLLIGIACQVAYSSAAATYITIIMLFVFVGSYQISFGPISWVMIGEIFPVSVRGQAIAICTLTNFATNFVVAFLLPTFQKLEGPGGLYLGFAAMAALAWAVIYFVVIETKMLTLEEIEALMIGPKRGERGAAMTNGQMTGTDSDVQLSKRGLNNV